MTQTWYVWDENTHGVVGLFNVAEVIPDEVFDGVGPDHVLNCSSAMVLHWLHQHRATQLETDNLVLQQRWNRLTGA